MRSRSPSIVRQEASDTYLVLDDLGGRLGRAWRETGNEPGTDWITNGADDKGYTISSHF